MKWFYYLAFPLLLLLGVWFFGHVEPGAELPIQEETAELTNREQAEGVGLQFMQDIVAVALRTTDDEAVTRLYQSLSRSARAEVSEVTLSRDIAAFAHIQDVPDQGVSVEDMRVVSEQEVYLLVGLNYSGGQVLRTIHLVIEDGVWKVDNIQAAEREEQFTAAGNLVRNNPGLELGVWYLVYEIPGAPGLNVQLEFTPTSSCVREGEREVCDPEVLTPGQRVSISGEQLTEEVVRVTSLEFR